MLSFLPAPIVGVITAILFLVCIMFFALLIVLLGPIKFLITFASGKRVIENAQHAATAAWIDANNLIMSLPTKITWEIEGHGTLKKDHWYFVFSNHQSWVDILVLQKVFNRKIPLLKFFLKRELLWSLPMGGLACWALDFPFMKRYSKTQLKKNPELKNKDLETTKLACNKFKLRPTTVMNFLEGTRFTPVKQQERSSPYQHLLRPKAGGVAFVVNELKEFITEVLDVTIIYNYPEPTFWNLLCGRITHIYVSYEIVTLEPNQYGDYYHDSVFRKQFQGWLNDRWRLKDALIAAHLSKEPRLENAH